MINRKSRDLFDFEDTFFNDLFKGFATPLSQWTVSAYGSTASYHSEATDTGARVTVDLPGVKAEDASVYVQENILHVEGKRGDKQYKTSFNIDGFDASTIKASLADGVMTVTLDREKKVDRPDRTEIKFEVKK